MKAIRESIIHPEHDSFVSKEFILPYFDSPWHFHPECELTYIVAGTGTRFVGDSAEAFQPGDLVLVGRRVPHYWRCSDSFMQNDQMAHSLVLQFDEEVFFRNPLREMSSVHLLLRKAQSGIYFPEGKRYYPQWKELLYASGFRRLMLFYELLHDLSKDPHQQVLSITEESQRFQARDSANFQKVLNYIFEKLSENISLPEVSDMVGMSEPAFCRYFKKRTRKTFTEYVNHLRIVQAAQQLIESDLSVSQIGYQSGFNNLSYFNRQFKKFKGKSPKEYRDVYLKKN